MPDEVADPARGAGVRVALQVHQSAVDHVIERSREQPSSCRAPLPIGPVTVDTTLRWVRKGPGVPATVVRETLQFRRDDAGNTALAQTLTFALPDGRETQRFIERRAVDGLTYAALDGRFAEASRLPEVPAEIRSGAQGAVDALLSNVRHGEGGSLEPAAGLGLCRAPAGPAPDAVSAGFARWGIRGRSGWLQWLDGAARMSLTVTFDERVRSRAEPVLAPDTVWPIDPDRSWSQAARFVEQGRADGWLAPPRVLPGQAPPIDPLQPAPSTPDTTPVEAREGSGEHP